MSSENVDVLGRRKLGSPSSSESLLLSFCLEITSSSDWCFLRCGFPALGHARCAALAYGYVAVSNQTMSYILKSSDVVAILFELM